MAVKCPGCGEDHEAGEWTPNPEIDRDLAALVALVLTDDATVVEFATLVGSEDRASSLLLRAVQTIAEQAAVVAHMRGEEHPREFVLNLMRKTLLQLAAPKPDPEEDDE